MKFRRFDYAAFLLFMTYAVCSLIIPVVLVEVAKDLHFDLDKGGMSAGGVLQMGRSATMVAAMLVCSMCATRFGLRRSLAVAAIFMALGITLAACSQWYWMLLTVLIIAGIGEGLVEGLATPFVGELHKNDEPGRYINFTHGFWSIGIFICIPLLGWLSNCNISWRWLCLITAAATLVPALILFVKGKKPVECLEGTGRFDASGAVGHAWKILKNKYFWMFFAAMFVAGGGEFGVTFWSASLLRLEYNASPLLGGVATAVFSAGMMIGRTGSGLWVSQRNLPRLIMIAAVAGAILSIFFYSINGTIAVMVLLFFTGLASAPFWPSVQSYSVDRLPELDSTTVYILLSCAGVPGCGVFSMIMGKVGDMYGLRAAFMVVPVCYLILALIIACDYFLCNGRKKMSSRQSPAQ